MRTTRTTALAAGLLVLAAASQAEYRIRPDANTLWAETCSNVRLGPAEDMDAWRNNQVEIQEMAQGGLMLTGRKADDDQVSTGRWVALDPAYPYVVLDIAGVKHGDGYRGLTFWILEHAAPPAGFGTNLQAGIFIWNAITPLHPLRADTRDGFFRVDLHNVTVALRSVKMVKAPECNVQMLPADPARMTMAPGDEVILRAVLPKGAEDVTVTLSQGDPSQRLAINGQATVQLKPVDAQDRIWEVRLTLERIDGFPEPVAKEGQILLRALPLGEGLPKAIWSPTTMPVTCIRQP